MLISTAETRRHIQRKHQKQKAPDSVCTGRGLVFNSGNVLLSHTLARAVPSGLQGLTAVFGMGTGGTPALQSPKSDDDEKSLNIDGQQRRLELVLYLQYILWSSRTGY